MNLMLIQLKIILLKKLNILNYITVHICHLFSDSSTLFFFFLVHFSLGVLSFTFIDW